MGPFLKGTTDADSFRSHSLKASLLLWCARAGFDKETGAVLGHLECERDCLQQAAPDTCLEEIVFDPQKGPKGFSCRR